jgi:hypothetical protein
MTFHKFLVLAALLQLLPLAAAQTLQERAEQLQSLGALDGVWTGRYEFVYASPVLPTSDVTDMCAEVTISGAEVTIRVAWAPEDDLVALDGDIVAFPDSNGFILHVQRAQAPWVEKWVMTFDRSAENRAYSSVTRTVNNWFVPSDAPKGSEYFSMHGVGTFLRSEGNANET